MNDDDDMGEDDVSDDVSDDISDDDLDDEDYLHGGREVSAGVRAQRGGT